jgi:hypothetical protein
MPNFQPHISASNLFLAKLQDFCTPNVIYNMPLGENTYISEHPIQWSFCNSLIRSETESHFDLLLVITNSTDMTTAVAEQQANYIQ